jgi:hypothetical protein
MAFRYRTAFDSTKFSAASNTTAYLLLLALLQKEKLHQQTGSAVIN